MSVIAAAVIGSAARELDRLMKTLRRIGKAVGEDDPTRIAASVEARLRQMVVSA